jgi:hypothetical protein
MKQKNYRNRLRKRLQMTSKGKIFQRIQLRGTEEHEFLSKIIRKQALAFTNILSLCNKNCTTLKRFR